METIHDALLEQMDRLSRDAFVEAQRGNIAAKTTARLGARKCSRMAQRMDGLMKRMGERS